MTPPSRMTRAALVLEEPEHAAARAVGPGFRHRIDNAARRQAVFGVELARQQLKLLDRLHRHPRLGTAVAAVERVVVVRPVHRVVDVADVLAGDADRVSAKGRHRHRRHHARQHAEVAGKIAVEARNLDELLGAHVAADRLRAGIHQGRFARDRDRLFDAADLDRDVGLRRAADRQRDVAALVFLEAGQLRGHFVYARRHRAQEERAISTADRLPEQAAVLVLDDDGDTRQRGSLLIGYFSAKICRTLLRERCRRPKQQRDDRWCEPLHRNLQLSAICSPAS